MRWLALLLICVLASACGDDTSSPPDSGTPDGGEPPVDAGPPPPVRAAQAPFVDWVDPFIATGGDGYGTGSAIPGPQTPFGMVRPGPDSSAIDGAASYNHCGGYWYQDDYIQGFSHTRLHGIGTPESGAVGVMPVTGGMTAERTTQQGYMSRFDKASEEASPGYYAVTLAETNVRVELTATERVALHRYTFPADSDAAVLFDIGHTLANGVEIADGSITVDPVEWEISGHATFTAGYSGRFGGMPVYFVARLSETPTGHGVWQAGTLAPGEDSRNGADTGAWLEIDTSTTAVVEMAVAISFIDVEHARMNLAAEAPTFDFDAVRAATSAMWEQLLSRVEIEGRSERDFEIFYTALYHTLLMPTLATDVDGSYRGLDREVHVADGFTYYTDFSLWDTFRTLHPLLTLLYPERQTDFLKSLVAMGEDGGYIPRWPLGIGYTGGMVGDSAAIVFGDSWVKGVRDFDLRSAYDSLRRTAMEPTPVGAAYRGRRGIAEYVTLGYVPIEATGGSASSSLEFAYADHSLANLAEALGEEGDRAMFAARAHNYANHYDPATGFLLGRNRDGTFPSDIDPFVWQDYYAEGNAWQYGWYAPHDLDGLAELMGGRAELLERLEMFFDQSIRRPYLPIAPALWYWHGNEPDLHAPWIGAALDRPAKTAEWTRWIIDRHYNDGPDGLPGNDDGGTLSAWYVFSASGFYAIAGLDDYLVGSPVLNRVVMHLPGGDFIVEAPESSEESIYVTGASLDGTPLSRARFTHEAIAGGATLRLEMATEPNDWGSTD